MFGEKLRKLRTDNNLTQEELAEKILVTRTAVSKWENNKGYPSIDSLKELSNLFGISIDELISDEDIENTKLIEDRNGKKYYWCAIGCLCIAVAATLLSYLLKIQYFNFISLPATVGYIIFGFLSKPKYKRIEAKRLIVPYLISRMVVFVIVVIVMITTMMQMQ